MNHIIRYFKIRRAAFITTLMLIAALQVLIAQANSDTPEPISPPSLERIETASAESHIYDYEKAGDVMPPAPLADGNYRAWKKSIEEGAPLPDKRELQPAH